jgi:hypothetical protein
MIVERFKNGDAASVYRRFRERGRMIPEGVQYISSWVSADLSHCYQVMECADRRLLEQWIDCWRNLEDFEVTTASCPAQGDNDRNSDEFRYAKGRQITVRAWQSQLPA